MMCAAATSRESARATISPAERAPRIASAGPSGSRAAETTTTK